MKKKQINPRRFVTVFPAYRNLHLYKDPGQLPYRFSKRGYETNIVCYNNEANYSESLKSINIKTISKNWFSRLFGLGFIVYLILNSRKVTILNIFHLKWDSIYYAFWYKLINPNGFVYLKMDNCMYFGKYSWENIFCRAEQLNNSNIRSLRSRKHKIHDMLTRKFVGCVDLWSVEDEESRAFYESNYSFLKDKTITLHNGHTLDLQDSIHVRPFERKENIFLTVSNLGTDSKSTDILLEAFRNISISTSWDLHSAGTVADSFKQYIDDYFQKYPDLINRVVFHGHLEKNELFALYNRAKIFCLPSRFETWANVFSEAMYFKNGIITTNHVSPMEIIRDKMGLIIDSDDISALEKAMSHLIRNQDELRKYAETAHLFAVDKLNWEKLVDKLIKEIRLKDNSA